MTDANDKPVATEQKKLAATSFDEVPEIPVSQRKKTSDYSKPVFMTQVTLHSDQAQQLLEHSFSRANQALYAATRMLRAQNKVREAREAEKQIDVLFDGFSGAINSTILGMEECLKAKSGQGAITLPVYDHRRGFEIAIRTVYSQRLINLFQRLDYLIALSDALELQAVCSPDECDNTTKSWCRQFRKLLQAVHAVRGSRTAKA
jgi:hypothetical protein